MPTVIQLRAGEEPPEEEYWLTIERDVSGLFFGTGAGRTVDGTAIFYASLPENDQSLELALAAASAWADAHFVEHIYVQVN
ncbi:MAG TPA: hypothetical protein VGL66_12595 [Caulobacteraceae bacterium]|jgi:hypothetical protein